MGDIMESRLERNKKRKKEYGKRIFKLVIILVMTFIFTQLVYEVNETIIELNVLDNTKIFAVDLTNTSLTILGKTYNLK